MASRPFPFRFAGEEQIIATAETVYVHVDTKTLKKQAVPQHLRDAFTRGAAGIGVDHAGYMAKQ